MKITITVSTLFLHCRISTLHSRSSSFIPLGIFCMTCIMYLLFCFSNIMIIISSILLLLGKLIIGRGIIIFKVIFFSIARLSTLDSFLLFNKSIKLLFIFHLLFKFHRFILISSSYSSFSTKILISIILTNWFIIILLDKMIIFTFFSRIFIFYLLMLERISSLFKRFPCSSSSPSSFISFSLFLFFLLHDLFH